MNIKTLGFCLVAGLFLACNTPQKAQNTLPAATPGAATPVKAGFVSWDKKLVTLGPVKKGEKRTLFFELTNTSGTEIQIDLVDACECTRVEYPRGPIAPGGKGRLDVTFDSSEKDAPETIGINVVFRNVDAAGNPRIETVEYSFEITK
jgi:peptidoglycan-associated lipoprotein